MQKNRENIAKDLAKLIGKEHILSFYEERICYAYDATNCFFLPDIVVLPIRTEQVSKVAMYAFENDIPIVPRGAGSGYTGGSLPVKGGIVISMERMNKILEINHQKRYAILEPGVVTLDFAQEVAKLGLLYPPDPSSDKMSTLGGNVGENAGGLKGRKYGVTKNYVLGLETVLYNGEILRTGIFNPDERGYDLVSLLIGSEGTLGVITKIALRLLPQVPYEETILASFEKMEDAAQVVADVTSAGIIPSVLEFIDKDTLDCVLDYIQVDFVQKGGPILLIEVDGQNKNEVHPEMEKIEQICRKNNAKRINFAQNKEEKEKLWKIRKSASASLLRKAPTKVNEDICVPPSQLPNMVRGIKELAKKYNININTFGHAGDGNLHVNIMTDRRKKEEMERVEKAVDELFDLTLKLDGTLSGEHGIGTTKLKFLEREVGKSGIRLMRNIKKAFDPKGLINPGKIFN